MDGYQKEVAVRSQRIATEHRLWAMDDRKAYLACIAWGDEEFAVVNFKSYSEWMEDSAFYAKRAMYAMGLTDEDQYYV